MATGQTSQRLRRPNDRGKVKHPKSTPLGDETEVSAMRCTVGTYDKKSSSAGVGDK